MNDAEFEKWWTRYAAEIEADQPITVGNVKYWCRRALRELAPRAPEADRPEGPSA